MSYVDRASLHKLLRALDGGGVKEGDILVEVGSAAFDGIYTDATDRPVGTGMNLIIGGFAVPFDSYSPATDTNSGKAYQLFVAPDVAEDTDSHMKTVSVFRSSQGAISGLRFTYVLFGRNLSTD